MIKCTVKDSETQQACKTFINLFPSFFAQSVSQECSYISIRILFQISQVSNAYSFWHPPSQPHFYAHKMPPLILLLNPAVPTRCHTCSQDSMGNSWMALAMLKMFNYMFNFRLMTTFCLIHSRFQNTWAHFQKLTKHPMLSTADVILEKSEPNYIRDYLETLRGVVSKLCTVCPCLPDWLVGDSVP